METVIRSLYEDNDDGTLGYIDHQYFRKLELGNDNYTYEDNWETFFFFISSKYNIIIIGGGPERLREQARDILVEFLSGDITYVSVLWIKTQPMLELVNKIKKEGPKHEGEYKNIMVDVLWKYIRKDDHSGAKREQVKMHMDPKDPKCVSKFPTFDKNMKDSEAFDTTMTIYRCNGLLNDEISYANYLDMYEDARFSSSSDPPPHQWIIFVIDTCKKALGI